MAKYDVFFSYSRADTERVAPLRDELRRMGYRVFFDVQSIDPGTPWKERLRRSISDSRTLVLCWSENTRGSEYVTFEYMQAETLHKRVFPWRLDKTPLPPMLEIQAIENADAAEVAARLKPALGWTLGLRRKVQFAIAAVATLLVAVGLWFLLRPPLPPPPWEFQGEVIDRNTRMPIAGVEVDVLSGNRVQTKCFTDSQGDYDLRLPPPRPAIINLQFRKDGYEAEAPLNVPATKPLVEDMAKLH